MHTPHESYEAAVSDAHRPTERAAQAAPASSSPARGPLRTVRRIGVAVVGSIVLAVGLVLLVTPGPAFVVIPVGLGILAIEFEWARRWLHKVKEHVAKVLPGDKQKSSAG